MVGCIIKYCRETTIFLAQERVNCNTIFFPSTVLKDFVYKVVFNGVYAGVRYLWLAYYGVMNHTETCIKHPGVG